MTPEKEEKGQEQIKVLGEHPHAPQMRFKAMTMTAVPNQMKGRPAGKRVSHHLQYHLEFFPRTNGPPGTSVSAAA